MITIDLSGKAILITGALGAIAEHMVRRLVEAAPRWFSRTSKRRIKPNRRCRNGRFRLRPIFICPLILPTPARWTAS